MYKKQFKGYTTVNKTKIIKQYDIDIVKRDLLNNFYTRKGERRGDPSYGSIIWDLLFELDTSKNRKLAYEDAKKILLNEKRCKLNKLELKVYEHGYIIEATLTYKSTNERFSFTQLFNKSLASDSLPSIERGI